MTLCPDTRTPLPYCEVSLCLICGGFLIFNVRVLAEGTTRSGVEKFEGMDVDEEGGDLTSANGPQRCKWHILQNLF